MEPVIVWNSIKNPLFSLAVLLSFQAPLLALPIADGSTFVEERFTVTKPKQMGVVVEAILKTVDTLGIDIKLAALTYTQTSSSNWIVHYGSALGDHNHQYVYQNPTRPFLTLRQEAEHRWRDPDFTYTLSAALSFLGIHVSLGPVHAFQADVQVQYLSNEKIRVFGDALLPASEAAALDFMTDIRVTKINALFVAGLRCTDICAPDVCQKNRHTLPKTGLDVIKCNPSVHPIGIKDFGKGEENYYLLGLNFFAHPTPAIQDP